MLTEYNNDIFNAEIHGDMVNIWKYIPVAGFTKNITRRGTVYYEKNVRIDEVNSFFTVEFVLACDNRKFVVKSLIHDNVDFICDDAEYAGKNGFMEMEHGVWVGRKQISSFNEITMIKHIENSSEKAVKSIKIDEFEDMWRRYVKEVSI